MGLTSTLFTGLSGLNVNQTRLSVVGNNIANVNTVAFKGSRALFKPQFYVTDSAGSPPSAEFGGTNPSQRGLGASVASIEKSWDPGAIEATGRATDLAIDGDGLFIVQGQEQKFSRDGSFHLNMNNDLVTSTGDFIQGFGVGTDGKIVTGALQNINIPLGKLTKAEATSEATFVGNLNAGGSVSTGASVLTSQPLVDSVSGLAPTDASLLVDLRDTSGGDFITAGATLSLGAKRGGRDLPPLTFDVTGASTVQDLRNFLQQGMGIDTTVPAVGTYTPGVTLVPNGGGTAAQLFITGNVGEQNQLEIHPADLTRSDGLTTFEFTEDLTSSPVGESVFTSVRVYDSLGNPMTMNITMTLESKQDTGTTWRFIASSADDTDALAFDPAATTFPGSVVGTGTLDFDSTGKLITKAVPAISIDRTATGAGTPLSVTLDFSAITALSSTTSSMIGSGNGQPMGSLAGYSFGANGIITGTFDNGLTTTLGQIALATFDNQQGLLDQGGNMFTAGPDSGVPKIAAPLELGSGAIRSGSLESSNVDLSAEFINLIIASTGFSASSRVITTSDQLITELLNSSR